MTDKLTRDGIQTPEGYARHIERAEAREASNLADTIRNFRERKGEEAFEAVLEKAYSK